TAEAEVDHFGRVGIGRHAGYGAAGGPDDRVGDVGGEAAAAAQYPDRQHLRVVGDAGHADRVVAQFGHGACDVCAVERAVRRRPAGRAFVGGFPVPVVVGARHAGVGCAARDERVGNEVVALQHVCVHVGVRHDAGVEYRHHHAFASRCVPRGRGGDAAGRVMQVPLVL